MHIALLMGHAVTIAATVVVVVVTHNLVRCNQELSLLPMYSWYDGCCPAVTPKQEQAFEYGDALLADPSKACVRIKKEENVRDFMATHIHTHRE